LAELVTLITPTGNRPEAFRLCEYYMSRQTYKGDLQWVVVDDCSLPTKVNMNQEYYVGPRFWEPGLNTQRFNMELALSKVRGEYILIIEDDEWYSPFYVETHVHLLKTFEAIGELNSRYYNLKVPGWKDMRNDTHVSLSQTGVTKNALPVLREAIDSGELYFDVCFWRKAKEKKLKYCLFSGLNLAVGMKCLPGRKGIGVGHTQTDYRYDAGFSKLIEWVGAQDAQAYINFTKRKESDEESNAQRV